MSFVTAPKTHTALYHRPCQQCPFEAEEVGGRSANVPFAECVIFFWRNGLFNLLVAEGCDSPKIFRPRNSTGQITSQPKARRPKTCSDNVLFVRGLVFLAGWVSFVFDVPWDC
jgi:hypothetical protein